MADSNVHIGVTADTGSAVSNLNKISESMQRVGKTTESISGTLSKVGKTLAGAFAVEKIKDFSLKILNVSADLEAMDSTFNSVFKGAEGITALQQLEQQAKKVGMNVDLLKQGYIKFGAQFKAVGMSGNEAMDSVAKATAVATDASAMYDLSVKDATDRLASFLRGEYDAGDAIGLTASETMISQFALENYGLKFDKLTEKQKENIRLDYAKHLQEQSGAVGQAQRESNSWAVAVQNLSATWNRFLERVGAPVLQAVIPIIQKVTDVIAWLGDKIKGFNFSSLTQQVPILGTAFTTLQGVIEPLKTAFLTLIDNVVNAVMNWYNNNKGTVDNLIKLFIDCFALIGSIFTNAVTIISMIWDKFGKYIVMAIVLYVGMILERIHAFLEIIAGVFNVISALLQGNWGQAWEGVKQILSGVLTFIYTLVVEKILGGIIGVFKSFFSGAVSIISNLASSVAGFFSKMVGDAGSIFSGLPSIVRSIFGTVKSAISEAIEGAVGVVKSGISRIKEFFSNLVLKLPNIALPHFHLSGSFDLAKLQVPHLSVDWYAKGGLFNSPSVIGVGEAGSEAVLPLTNDRTMSMIAGTIAEFMPDSAGNGTDSPVVIENININALTKEEDPAKLAKRCVEAIDRELSRRVGAYSRSKGRNYI